MIWPKPWPVTGLLTLHVIMEKLVSADIPVEEKLYRFFAERLALKRSRHDEDPDLFASYMELGDEHFEVIKGYVDLADHYMASILAEAMEEGYFAGLELDQVVSLVNTMVQPFVNPKLMMQMLHLATEERLQMVVHTILGRPARSCCRIKNQTGVAPRQLMRS